ncbi:MAG: hypothetical protein E7812_15055 [Phenylobacterium sp.]|nr:MAG: hypothetical protein E7812_15055 [Phenylobacterium sp.]
MNPVIDRLKVIFVGIFLVINIGLAVWEFGWEIPRENCEKAHKWWDNAQRVCGTPILVSDVTGRVIDNAQARADAFRAVGRTPPASLGVAAAAPPKAPAPAAAKSH